MSEVNKQWGLKILWLLTLTLMIVVGAIGWQLKLLIDRNSRADLMLALDTQQRQLILLKGVVEKHGQQFQQLADHSNKIAEGLKGLDRTVHEGSPAWRYTQIQFYLERAAQETYVMKDPLAARSWLQAALDNAIHLQQPNLLPVQEAIQQDIQDLSQTGGNAIAQAMLSLSVLSNSINTLPHKQTAEKMSEQNAIAPEDEKQSWRASLKSGWDNLKSLIRVRTTDGELVPYFSKDEQALINENVALILSQASFSAMRAQETLYNQQVDQAIIWINRYYDTTSPTVQAALTTLQHLEKVSVIFNPPSRLKSFDTWTIFMQQQEKSL